MEALQPGQRLGPYQVISQIGQGGMATVYKAYQPAMDRYVAVKVLPSGLAQDPQFVARFRQEATTIANLEHTHILPVYDYGESDGLTYLVMRYLDAGTLNDRLRGSPLPLPEIDRLLTQLASALQYAHERGVVHRDLKPSNALVDARGDLYLTDFGIAKLLESDRRLTSTGAMIGTPAYMSPEQAQGLRVDGRTDIYSLGIILYEMVTGRVPFEADTPLAVVLKHISAPLPLPSALKPDVSPAIERVLLKALAKNPDDRFASVADLMAAWRAALAQAEAPPSVQSDRTLAVPAAAAPVPPTVAAPAQPMPAPPEPPPASAAPRPPRPRLLGFASLTAVVGVVACVGVLLASLAAAQLLDFPGALLGAATPERAVEAEATGLPDPASLMGAPVAGLPEGWAAWPPANSIQTVVVHGDRIYTGGWGGITVWDRQAGTAVEHYTVANGLPSARVNQVLVDPATGVLAAATDGGVAIFDGQTWVVYNSADGLDSDIVYALAGTDDALFAGTGYGGEGGGLNRLTEQGWQRVNDFPSSEDDSDHLSHIVNALAVDPAGGLWVGTENGLGYLDPGADEWRRFTSDDGLPGNYITALLVDAAGEVWVAAYGDEPGVARWRGGSFEPVPQLQGFSVYASGGMLQDAQGRYWVAGDGLYRYDPSTADWTYIESSRLPATSLYGLAVDDDGRLYLGSDNGLVVQAESRFTTWTAPNLPRFGSDHVHILEAPDGALWFAGSGYADRFDPASEAWSPVDNLPEGCFPLAFDAALRLWCLEYDEAVVVVEPSGGATRLSIGDGVLPAGPTGVAFGPAGVVWIGTEAGVVEYDGQSVVDVYSAASVGLSGDYVLAMLGSTDGALWVSTRDDNGENPGLSRLANGEWQHFGPSNPFTDETWVSSLAETSDGAIWVASYTRLYRFAEGAWTQAGGGDLPGGAYALAAAPDGTVWVGMYGAGLARLVGGTWAHWGPVDGVIGHSVYDIHLDPSGVVYLATDGGAMRVAP